MFRRSVPPINDMHHMLRVEFANQCAVKICEKFKEQGFTCSAKTYTGSYKITISVKLGDPANTNVNSPL